jgi:hypothetical protein
MLAGFLILIKVIHYVRIWLLCSGLMGPDTLIRDNIDQLLRCRNEAKTNEQTVF